MTSDEAERAHRQAIVSNTANEVVFSASNEDLMLSLMILEGLAVVGLTMCPATVRGLRFTADAVERGLKALEAEQ